MISKHLPHIRQGDTYSFALKYPETINLTGYKWYFTLKEAFTDLDSEAILDYSKLAGDNSLDMPTTGMCFFVIPPSITENLPAGAYYYSFVSLSPLGLVDTLAPPISDYKFKIRVNPRLKDI